MKKFKKYSRIERIGKITSKIELDYLHDNKISLMKISFPVMVRSFLNEYETNGSGLWYEIEFNSRGYLNMWDSFFSLDNEGIDRARLVKKTILDPIKSKVDRASYRYTYSYETFDAFYITLLKLSPMEHRHSGFEEKKEELNNLRAQFDSIELAYKEFSIRERIDQNIPA